MGNVTNFEDFSDMLVDHGRQQGLVQGRAEGKAEGERDALLRIVAKRFGRIPPAFVERIEQAAAAQTQAWIERALDADNLAAVFADKAAPS